MTPRPLKIGSPCCWSSSASPNRSNPETYGYVLETGRVALEGRHDALIADDRVRRAYFGM
jgi:hypothetical protein